MAYSISAGTRFGCGPPWRRAADGSARWAIGPEVAADLVELLPAVTHHPAGLSDRRRLKTRSAHAAPPAGSSQEVFELLQALAGGGTHSSNVIFNILARCRRTAAVALITSPTHLGYVGSPLVLQPMGLGQRLEASQ